MNLQEAGLQVSQEVFEKFIKNYPRHLVEWGESYTFLPEHVSFFDKKEYWPGYPLYLNNFVVARIYFVNRRRIYYIDKAAWKKFPLPEDRPEKDLSEVVRCRECKNLRLCGGNTVDSSYNWCVHFKHHVKPDDFCSYGEQKEEIRNV